MRFTNYEILEDAVISEMAMPQGARYAGKVCRSATDSTTTGQQVASAYAKASARRSATGSILAGGVTNHYECFTLFIDS